MSQSRNDTITEVRLRPVEPDDLPLLYEFQLDNESNQMAFTHPRNKDAFDVHWNGILADSSIFVRAIIADGALAGCISCFQSKAQYDVGYWIGREFWGNGIATCALKLLLEKVSRRPLHSRVAVANAASIRVLSKCGFREVRREWSPATERFVECEEVVMTLSD